MRSLYAITACLISQLFFSQNDPVAPYIVTQKPVSGVITENFSYLLTDAENIDLKKLLKNEYELQKNYCGCEKKDLKDLPKHIWLIGKIQNATIDTLDLIFYTSNAQKVDTYIISETDTLKKTVGYIQKTDERYIKEMPNAINIKLFPNEEKTIVLHQKIHIDYELISKFNICTHDVINVTLLENYRFYQNNMLLSSILLGGLVLLFLYNFFMFCRILTNNYLYYSLYLASTFVFILIMKDRNQNFNLRDVMLFFPLISEVSYCLCIVFYGLFVKSIIQTTNRNISLFLNTYFALTSFYIVYLITIFFINTYSFNETTLWIKAVFKCLSLFFVLILIFQLYKTNKTNTTNYVKYIILGSVVLTFSYLLQTFFDYVDRTLFSMSFSKKVIRNHLSILIGTVLEISFFSYALYINTSQIIKEKIALENLSALKSRFFVNISHEFRTPLTLIKSPTQSLQSKITDKNLLKELALIDQNSDRMLELTNQLLELSKIDDGNLKLMLKAENITTFINAVIEPFVFEAKENQLNFVHTIDSTPVIYLFDRDIVQKIATNLLLNAFKYSPEKEEITFSASVKEDNLIMAVTNTNPGLTTQDLVTLFERFYQVNEKQPGAGIGLSLVKELVDLYKGKIETSLVNNRLSFKVTLPLKKVNQEVKEDKNPVIESFEKNELPVLLILDDNPDIRTVLKELFKNNYHILEADNGRAALKTAQKEIPDCIISDVMMPNMNGYEFVNNIKINELTSFIPVILLTAKASEESHLEGLKNKADAYLTKPFNHDIIKETVNQLITERQKLHQRYSRELILRPADIVINSVDEKFVRKLQTVLDKELSNAAFSSENFASALGISRMQLHRKLKSLLGVSTTEFLRNERLKVAGELLKKDCSSISDVAYAVGFNDVSYFSKCFKEMYHYTPTEYMEKNKIA